MGTSTKWSGPTGAGWRSLRRSIGQLGRSTGGASSIGEIPRPRQGIQDATPSTAAALRGRRFREALKEEVRRDPNAFGLRPAMGEAAGRLVATLSDLRAGFDVLGAPPREWTGSNADWFVYAFVRAVAGEATGIVDALVRRSAMHCAEEVLANPRAREAIETRDSSPGLAMDLFCAVYTLFFADVVTELAKAAVSEQVKLAMPGLVIIDPGGKIPDWVGEQVAGLIPNPCEQKHKQSDDGRSVIELAADVVWDNVDRALGLANGAGS